MLAVLMYVEKGMLDCVLGHTESSGSHEQKTVRAGISRDSLWPSTKPRRQSMKVRYHFIKKGRKLNAKCRTFSKCCGASFVLSYDIYFEAIIYGTCT